MNVKVYHELTEIPRFTLTFELPKVGHCVVHIPGETWTRGIASQALNSLGTVYGISRKNVRFIHSPFYRD